MRPDFVGEYALTPPLRAISSLSPFTPPAKLLYRYRIVDIRMLRALVALSRLTASLNSVRRSALFSLYGKGCREDTCGSTAPLDRHQLGLLKNK